MFEGTNSVLNNESFPLKKFLQILPNLNIPMQNSYCDHRNFDSVNQS
jgi:hypothetical protein